MKITVTEKPNTVRVERNEEVHTARWRNEEVLTRVVGDENLLRAAMIAWSGENEFELTDAQLEEQGGGWWAAP